MAELQFRLPDELKDRFKEVSEEKKISMTDALKAAVYEFVRGYFVEIEYIATCEIFTKYLPPRINPWDKRQVIEYLIEDGFFKEHASAVMVGEANLTVKRAFVDEDLEIEQKRPALEIIFDAETNHSLGWETKNYWREIATQPVIKYPLAPRHARAILELFGVMAFYGENVFRIIKKIAGERSAKIDELRVLNKKEATQAVKDGNQADDKIFQGVDNLQPARNEPLKLIQKINDVFRYNLTVYSRLRHIGDLTAEFIAKGYYGKHNKETSIKGP